MFNGTSRYSNSSIRLLVTCIGVFFSMQSAGMLVAQTEFELVTPDSEERSTAILDENSLIVKNAGREFVYARETRLDEEGFTGFMNQDLRQAILWPATNQGRLRVGSFDGEGFRFRNSQMEIRSRREQETNNREGRRPNGRQGGRRPAANDPLTIDFKDAPIPREEGIANVTIQPTRVLFSPDGSTLIIAAHVIPQGVFRSAPSFRNSVENAPGSAVDAIILFWDMRNKRWGEPILGSSDVAIADDGTLAHITSEGRVVLGDPRNSTDVTLETELQAWGQVEQIQFQRMDGKLILMAVTQKRVAYWDVADKSILGDLKLDGGQVIEWMPNSEAVAMGRPWANGGRMEQGDGIRIVDPGGDGGNEEARFVGHEYVVSAIAIGLNANLIASADNGDRELRTSPTLIVWSETSKKIIGNLDHYVADLEFSPDGNILVTAGSESSTQTGLITLWDISAGLENTKVIRSLKGHKNAVTSVAFNPNGNLLASVSLDETVKVWPMQDESRSNDTEVVLTVSDQDQRERFLESVDFSIARLVPVDEGNSFTLQRVDKSPTSNERGIYRYVLEPGKYQLTLNRDGYESKTEVIDVNDERLAQTVLLKSMTRTHSIVIDLRDDESRPVLGADVSIPDQNLVNDTNRTGTYKFLLPPGTYEATIRKAGFDERRVTLRVSDSGYQETVALKRTAPMSYSIVLTLLTEERRPIENAEITIEGKPGITASDSSGICRMSLFPGIYDVTIKKVGFEPTTRKIAIRDRDIVESIQLKTSVAMSYAIVLGIRDENANPVNDAAIAISGVTSKPATDNNGNYSFQLKDGTYDVSVAKQGFKTATTSLTVKGEALTKTIDLTAMALPTFLIELKVLDDKGSSLRDATIKIPGVSGNPELNDNGNYEVSLEAGTYEVGVTRQGFKPATKTLTVKDQPLADTIELIPTAPVAFALVINLLDDNSTGINDAKFTISGNSDQPKTDQKGGYEFLLEPGTYEITVEKPGYNKVTKAFVVKEQPLRETIEMVAIVAIPDPPKGTYQFLLNVVDQENNPLPGLDIVIDRNIQVSKKGSEGAYSFNLPPAIYEFEVSADGLDFQSGRFAIESSDVELRLAPVAKEEFEEMQLKAMIRQLDFNLDDWVDKKDFPDGGWEQFKVYDENDSDELDWKELRPLLKSQQEAAATSNSQPADTERPEAESDPEILVAEMNSRLDFNGDGRLSKEDFSDSSWEQITSIVGKPGATELNEDDLKKLVQPEEPPTTSNEESDQSVELSEDVQLEQLHRNMDFDLNGVVDKEDFSEFSWTELEKLDKDGSETLSSDELRSFLKKNNEDSTDVTEVTKIDNGIGRGTLTIRKSEPISR